MTRTKRPLNNGPRIQQEKEIVAKMIAFYCRKKHKQKEPCKDCAKLKKYAWIRLSVCQFGEEKNACSSCKVHCYKPEFREKIKRVMRFAGPWMFIHHPIYSVKHLFFNQ